MRRYVRSRLPVSSGEPRVTPGRHLCWRGESVWRSGRQRSPDRARRLRGPYQLTELAASGLHKSSQRGPATGTRIRDANTSALRTTTMPCVRGAGLYVTPRTDLIHTSQLRHRPTRCANTLPTVRSGHTVLHRVSSANPSQRCSFRTPTQVLFGLAERGVTTSGPWSPRAH